MVKLPVNARAPVRDDTVFSDYCFFVWTGKKDSKTRRGDGFFENGGKNLCFQTKTVTCGQGLGR